MVAFVPYSSKKDFCGVYKGDNYLGLSDRVGSKYCVGKSSFSIIV